MKARYIVIPLIILIVISTTLVWAFKPFAKNPEYDLFEVSRGSVATTVSVSGSVINDKELELSFLSPGIVKTVGVEVGDRVNENDLLISLDTSVLQQQANQARASIASARAMLDKANNSLRPQDKEVLNSALNNARVALDIARDQLQDAYKTRDNELESAKVALNNAQTAYDNAVNIYQSSQTTINQSTEMAKVSLTNSLTALSQAQTNYNYILSLYNLGQTSWSDLQQAQMNLQNANSAYNTARVQYDMTLSQLETERNSSKAQLDSASSSLANAEVMYNTTLNASDIKINNAENMLRSAESSYNLAEAQYYQSTAPTHSADIESISAQLSASNASLGIVNAQINQANMRAPIAGVVTAVNVKEGELSSMSQPAVILETDSDFHIEAYISEVDINKIEIGQDIKIQFDAIENSSFRGQVASIDPAATISLGVINYKIDVVINDLIDDIRSSMTADLDILTDNKDNVLFVPRRALIKKNGEYFANVLTSNGPEEYKIEIGLIGDTEVEILAGLNEGDQIILREL